MVIPIVQILIVLMILGVVLYLINRYLPMDATIKMIINVVIVILLILWLLSMIGFLGPVTLR